jgi:hypothetical protein
VVLVVVALSGLLGGRLRPGVASLARPSTAALAAGLGGLLVLGLATNAVSLASGLRDWTNRSNEARAYIALLDEVPAAAIARPAAVEWNIPGPDGMRQLIAAHGSPARDALLPGVVPQPTELDRDRALFRLVGGGFRVVGEAPPGDPDEPRIVAVEGVAAVVDGCVRLDAGPVDRLRLALRIDDGGAIRVSAAADAVGAASLHRAPLPQRPNGIELPVGPRAVTVVVPALDGAVPWLVTLDVPAAAGPLVACPFRPPVVP